MVVYEINMEALGVVHTVVSREGGIVPGARCQFYLPLNLVTVARGENLRIPM